MFRGDAYHPKVQCTMAQEDVHFGIRGGIYNALPLINEWVCYVHWIVMQTWYYWCINDIMVNVTIFQFNYLTSLINLWQTEQSITKQSLAEQALANKKHNKLYSLSDPPRRVSSVRSTGLSLAREAAALRFSASRDSQMLPKLS